LRGGVVREIGRKDLKKRSPEKGGVGPEIGEVEVKFE